MKRPVDIQGLVRPHLHGVEPYEGLEPPEVLAERLGLPPERLVKLDGNENPWGPSPRVLEALSSFRAYHLYPDPMQRRIRSAVAAYAGVSPEQVVCGNGSDELIDLLLRLFVEPGQAVVDLPPTFAMYRAAARIHGARVVEVPRDEGFRVDAERVCRALTPETRLVFLASPNNPTGETTPLEAVRRMLEVGRVVVVDETYYEFCGYTTLPLLEEFPNLVIMRTLSKWAGLAGLRFGYCIMHPQAVRYMLAIKAPYNISVAAEVAALASLEDREALLQRVRLLAQERERLFSMLQALPGALPLPSQGNFVLCRFPGREVGALYEGLRRRGILVRYLRHDPRLADALRISVGTPEQNNAVVDALRELLSQGG